jgi:hypothetical protein
MSNHTSNRPTLSGELGFNPFGPTPAVRRVTLIQMRREFAALGYEAHLRYDMTRPGAAELEVRSGSLRAPVRFRGPMVMSTAWAHQHAALLELVSRYRGSIVSRRLVL